MFHGKVKISGIVLGLAQKVKMDDIVCNMFWAQYCVVQNDVWAENADGFNDPCTSFSLFVVVVEAVVVVVAVVITVVVGFSPILKKNVIYSLSEPVVTMKVITTSFALYRGEGKFMIATSKTDIMCSSGGRFYTHHSNSVNGLKHMSWLCAQQ